MGTLEKEVQRRVRYGKIERVILGTLGGVGVMGIAILAPNALQILNMFSKDITRSKKQGAKKAIYRLQQKGLIAFEKNKRGTFVRITPQGERVLNRLGASPKATVRKRKWDKKWRIVVFDIKEGRRRVRDQLRKTLLHIGFIRLQNSVWVYPYDCEELVALLKADFRIGKDVLYIIADAIEYDQPIRGYFGLK